MHLECLLESLYHCFPGLISAPKKTRVPHGRANWITFLHKYLAFYDYHVHAKVFSNQQSYSAYEVLCFTCTFPQQWNNFPSFCLMPFFKQQYTVISYPFGKMSNYCEKLLGIVFKPSSSKHYLRNRGKTVYYSRNIRIWNKCLITWIWRSIWNEKNIHMFSINFQSNFSH